MSKLERIINSPENYAAIYARTSSQNENNSIEGQITLGREKAEKENLLIYSIYKEHVSAKSKAPQERKEFSKLLRDAKAGCFKTLIIYRLDRLVRKFEHWINIKRVLSSMGIRIICSDETQIAPTDSVYNDFLQNLTVMVAEMEPNTISLRTSEGRKIKRRDGVYNPGKYIPFGFTKPKSNVHMNNSIFKQEPIKIDFVKYLFLEFKEYIVNGRGDGTNPPSIFLKILFDKSKEVINDMISRLKNAQHLLDKNNNSKNYEELINTCKKFIKENNKDKLISILEEIKIEYFSNKSDGKRKLNSTLRKSVYAGVMLLDAKHLCKGLKYTDDGTGNITCEDKIDETAFRKTTNLQGIVPYEDFSEVYSYLIYSDLKKIDKSEDFLFKNIIKCSCSKKIMVVDHHYLYCGNPKCFRFYKDDLVEFILYKLTEDILLENSNFKKFKNEITKRINVLEKNIKFNKKAKINILQKYILTDNAELPNALPIKNELISNDILICNQYRSKLEYIQDLEDTLESSINEDNIELDIKIKKCIKYILRNTEIFSSLFREVIKEIRVNTNGKQLNGTIKIKYEFTT